MTPFCSSLINSSLTRILSKTENSNPTAMAITMSGLSVQSISFAVSDSSFPCNLNPRSRSVSLLSKINCQFQHSIKRSSIGMTERTPGFRWRSSVGENVGSTVVPTSVPVRVAHELQQAGHRYLDVRTEEEFRAGHPAGAHNIPYMFRVGAGMTKNPMFTEEVLSHFRNDDKIILGCQSGKRSLMAASDLLAAGFTGVTDIAGGYAAWNQNGLPVES